MSTVKKLVVALMLGMLTFAPVCEAGGKGGKGGGGSEPPPTPPLTLEIRWLGSLSYDHSDAVDINNHGVVVGKLWNDGDSARHAYVWDSIHGMLELNVLAPPLPGYTLEWASEINDNNMIAGWAWDSVSSKWEVFRCQYDPIKVTASVEIIPGYTGNGDIGLNESGDIAFVGQNPGEVVVVPSTGSPFTITAPGAASVNGMNDSGQLLIGSDGGNFRYTPGASPALQILPTGRTYRDMNQFGSLCGTLNRNGGKEYAFKFQDVGGELAFGPLSSYARGINDYGDCCGSFNDFSANIWRNTFLFTADNQGVWGFWSASSLLPDGGDSKWKAARYVDAQRINNTKQICGTATWNVDLDGNSHFTYESYNSYEAYLLTPVQ